MSFAKYAHFCSLALERSFIGKTAESGGPVLFFLRISIRSSEFLGLHSSKKV